MSTVALIARGIVTFPWVLVSLGPRDYRGPKAPEESTLPAAALEGIPEDAEGTTATAGDEAGGPGGRGTDENEGFFVEDLSDDAEAAAAALAADSKAVAGPKGLVTGIVRSARDGMPLVGATVEVPGTEYATKTGIDGSFRLELPEGTHTVRVREDTHEPRVFEGLELADGGSESLHVELRPMPKVGQTVIVEADVAKESEGARLEQRKNAIGTRDIMSREEIIKSGGGAASSVARRIVGATIVDGKYLFVRGLGHRYGNTLLDEVRVPSPEPDLRTIPLDVVPAAALSAINIQKTFTPDVPADFAGGSTQLETREVPDGALFGLSASVGINTATTGRPSVKSRSFAQDYFALGNLPRRLPEAIPTDRRVDRNAVDENFQPVFTPEDIERFGESMLTHTRVDRGRGPPNLGAKLNVGYGRKTRRAGRVGFLLTSEYEVRHGTRRGKIRQFGLGADRALVPQVDYDLFQTTRNVRLSTLGIVKWDVRPRQRIGAEVLYARTGEDQVRELTGQAITVSGADPVLATRLRYIMRSIMVTRLGGRHVLPRAKGLSVDWFGSYAQARRDDPHMREMLFTRTDVDGPYKYDAGNDAGKITFLRLLDHTGTAGANLVFPFRQWAGITGRVKVGVWLEGKRRSFWVRRFTYQVVGTLVDRIPDGTGNVLRADTIGGGPGDAEPFFLQETTRPNDNYRATNGIYAGYASLELPLVRWFKVAGGVRFEASDIDMATFDPFDPDADADRAALRDRDFFPSLSLIFSPTPRQNLRLAGTRTIARPEFRELAPFTFTDFVGGFDVQGNRFLRSTRIWNVDLRWEFFPSAAEVVAVSAFYKRFDAPIERVAAPRIPPLASFLNADAADAAGGELELRTQLGFLAPSPDRAAGRRAVRRRRARRILSKFSFGANFAYIWSRVRLPQERTCGAEDEACRFEQLFDVSTSRRRPLQGQSPYVVNAYLSFDHEKTGTYARVLLNTFGPFITQVSGLGLPDVYQQPVYGLDVVFRQRLYHRLAATVSGTNVLDWPIHWTQGGQTAMRFRRGATLSFGLSWSY